MSESCNSRHFSWLMKSCFPNPNHDYHSSNTHQSITTTTTTDISSLPDDLLLECLSRVPSSTLPSLSFVCRRWSRLLLSPSFLHLRRHLHPLHHSLFALSSTTVHSGTLHFDDACCSWILHPFNPSLPLHSHAFANFQSFLSQARLSAIGPRIFIMGRNAMLRYDTWTRILVPRTPMLFCRKKFASAVVASKIYVAGGASRPPAVTVDEYDPETDTWRVVSHVPRIRYGCIGASVEGVFYVIGGLKIGDGTAGGREAHLYASSMDLYDVEARAWLRSRALPGGGCVVAACAAMGHVYVLANHAVELSFWRFDARRNGGGFGEWSRMKGPPLPGQVRVDSRVKFSCVGAEDKVVLVQVMGCIDDLLRRSGRSSRGFKQSLVLVYHTASGDWTRAPDLPEVIQRATCVDFES
ncbi:hypothetical protein JRO89_XS05G0102100 [Xanthoceras sorbifolium]|uniref:F-box domain-containing protein n=1 Tax=Xanthoceras sorbifolium TaxID=99658 RepID=A0ABQ8I1A5_9ROSI|nr:hypothetical protein JRO89_XS05G0102100 [Xanthoceras sorbifolium]